MTIEKELDEVLKVEDIFCVSINNKKMYPQMCLSLFNGTKEQMLAKAIEDNQEIINKYLKLFNNDPSSNWYHEQYEYYAGMTYELMTESEYKQKLKEYYLTMPIEETDKENYLDMLGCLPPLKWVKRGNIDEFCIMEMLTGSYTNQYAHDELNNKYYKAVVDFRDESTWIHNRLKEIKND